MDLYNFSENEILSFILILVRIGAFFMVFPLFDQTAVPNPTKILLSLVTAFVLFPVVGATPQKFVVELMTWFVIKEMFIGFIIAFVAKFFFFILSICGEIITVSIGLSSAQVYNPTFGSSTMVIERFQLYLGTLFFLAFNGHHIFIRGLAKSFELVPISEQILNPLIFRDIAYFAEQILIIGIQLSAPIMATILFLNVGMGIIGRAVPQVNVIVTSWSINILAGFAIMIAMIPLMTENMKDSLNMVGELVFKVLKEI